MVFQKEMVYQEEMVFQEEMVYQEEIVYQDKIVFQDLLVFLAKMVTRKRRTDLSMEWSGGKAEAVPMVQTWSTLRSLEGVSRV